MLPTQYMKKLPRKRLAVPTETVRQLDASELQQIIGGVSATGDYPGINPRSCTPGCGTVSNLSMDC